MAINVVERAFWSGVLTFLLLMAYSHLETNFGKNGTLSMDGAALLLAAITIGGSGFVVILMLGFFLACQVSDAYYLPITLISFYLSYCFVGKLRADSEEVTFARNELEEEIRSFCYDHCPGNMGKIPALLKKYRGREELLLEKLQNKYIYNAGEPSHNSIATPVSPAHSTASTVYEDAVQYEAEGHHKQGGWKMVVPGIEEEEDFSSSPVPAPPQQRRTSASSVYSNGSIRDASFNSTYNNENGSGTAYTSVGYGHAPSQYSLPIDTHVQTPTYSDQYDGGSNRRGSQGSQGSHASSRRGSAGGLSVLDAARREAQQRTINESLQRAEELVARTSANRRSQLDSARSLTERARIAAEEITRGGGRSLYIA